MHSCTDIYLMNICQEKLLNHLGTIQRFVLELNRKKNYFLKELYNIQFTLISDDQK